MRIIPFENEMNIQQKCTGIIYTPNNFRKTVCDNDGSLNAKKTHPNATK